MATEKMLTASVKLEPLDVEYANALAGTLGEWASGNDEEASRDLLSHEQVFGHLANDQFTAQEAAEYLEVSLSTFRRYVHDGRLKPSSELGRNQLFATSDLKAFKRAHRNVKG